MRSYPKLRKAIKWGGAACFALLVATWTASLRWQLRWEGIEYRHSINAGELHSEVRNWFLLERYFLEIPGLYLDDQPTWPRWKTSFTHPRFTSEPYTGFVSDDISFDLPLWLPALLTLAITIPAWRLDALARRRSGLCSKCGYSLAGLPACSPCPECGKPSTGSAS